MTLPEKDAGPTRLESEGGTGIPVLDGNVEGRPLVPVPASRPGAGIGAARRLRYWQRIASAYLGPRKSHLTFWHGTPELNTGAVAGELGPYWQRFAAKADYPGHYDAAGIPMLDYHGHVGLQYNPIAIAQYGLGNYNLFRETNDSERERRYRNAADWLVRNLEPNQGGLEVWNHHFDWEYRTPLSAPWYSALSQGQGISLLVRAHAASGEGAYLEAAARGLESFFWPLERGGVAYRDAEGYLWFEETVVDPPTHILNGFMWAAWGVYDYALHAGSSAAERLWDEAVRTLRSTLERFDIGYWSLYDQAGTALPNAASWFYHALHVVQLEITHRLTGDEVFAEYARRWDRFRTRFTHRTLATAHKALFKILYY